MAVQDFIGYRAQGLDDKGTDGDVGHEAAVHDINMHPVGTCWCSCAGMEANICREKCGRREIQPSANESMSDSRFQRAAVHQQCRAASKQILSIQGTFHTAVTLHEIALTGLVNGLDLGS